MIMFKTSLLLATLASAQAFDLGALRGFVGEDESKVEQFSCAIAGSGGQDACDATTADDGGNCVWCSVSSFGFCLSKEQAAAMEDKLPGLTCDGDVVADDDQAPAGDDDQAPAEDDDSAATDDDAVPDDYWKCLKDPTDATTCASAKCTWCDTKAGYGVCMNSETAESVSKYDFYDCHMSFEEEEAVAALEDPYDTACIMASMQGDESTCDATVDSDGQPCEWCIVSSSGLCLNADQAELAEQFGASCKADTQAAVLEDPYDPTCVQASLQGDESICEATADSDGNACEWCMISNTGICLNADQADMAEQFGADCNMAEEIEEVEDPYDTACLMASMQGDESSCEATVDSDGQPCEWCIVSSSGLCLDADQAELAEQFGASCNAEKKVLQDPYDISCIQASMPGQEVCEGATDADGQACEWCMLYGTGFCANLEQVDVASQIGADCGGTELVATTA